MAKPVTRKAAKPTPSSIELNRWCIEMATHWPMIHIGGFNSVGTAFGQMQPSQQIDADVIGRAAKIKAWVLA